MNCVCDVCDVCDVCVCVLKSDFWVSCMIYIVKGGDGQFHERGQEGGGG